MGITNLDALQLGGLNAPAIKRVRVAVTTDEISNLAAAPKELVPATSGKVAVPIYCSISKTATTAHDDAALDGDLKLQLSGGTSMSTSYEADGFVDDTTAETAVLTIPALTIPHADEGEALQLENTGAEFTDGGSADTAFVVELVYFEAEITNVAE